VKKLNKFLIAFIVFMSPFQIHASESNYVKSMQSVVRVYNQTVYFVIPETLWPPYSERQDSGVSFLLEIVPKGQTLDVWSEMITVSGAKNVATLPHVTKENFSSFMIEGFRNACPTTFSLLMLKEESNETKQTFVVSCGNISGKSETALIQVIRGTKDFYTIQWAFRGKQSKIPLDLKEQEWMEKINTLNPRLIDNI